MATSCSTSPREPEPCVSDGIHSYAPTVSFYGRNGGVITIDAKWGVECIEEVHVDVDGTYVGSIRRDAPVRWDSRTVADGRHVVGFEADGWDRDTRELWTDNTPPKIVVCEPAVSRWGELIRFGGFRVVYDEPCCVWLVYSDGLEPGEVCVWEIQDTWHYPYAHNDRLPGQLWVPRWHLPGYVVGDYSFNPVATDQCGAYYEAWLKPWGEGPIPGIESRKLGRFNGAHVVYDKAPYAELMFLDRDTGRLGTLGAEPPDPWNPVPIPGLDPARTVTQLEGRAWLETLPDGTLELRALVSDAWPGRDGYVTTLDPEREPRVAPADGDSVAWTELGDDGRRVGRVATDWLQEGRWDALPPITGSPGMDVLEVHALFSSWSEVAIVEAAPGGPGQVRALSLALDLLGWEDLGGVLNRDPTRSASQVRAAGWDSFLLAWVEDGQVLSRIDMRRGQGFSAPAVMNRDPAAPARHPRFNRGLTLSFLERGPSGDRLEVREPKEALYEWRSWAPLELGEVTDHVTAFDLSLVVAWADAEGRVKVRAFNE